MTDSTPPPPTELSYEQRRTRRKREVRKRTESLKYVSKRELELGRLLNPDAGHPRPVTRADCVDGPRPCPFVGCKYALYLDVNSKTGSITLNFPDLEPGELATSCALDVADEGGATLERVGDLLNVTRERTRQLEVRALTRMAHARAMGRLREYADEGPVGRRRLPVLQGVP